MCALSYIQLVRVLTHLDRCVVMRCDYRREKKRKKWMIVMRSSVPQVLESQVQSRYRKVDKVLYMYCISVARACTGAKPMCPLIRVVPRFLQTMLKAHLPCYFPAEPTVFFSTTNTHDMYVDRLY